MFTIKSNINQFNRDTSEKKYKVLLNAGGGCFGYIITNLMASLQQNIYKKIDVVAGTSIGGILSLLYSVNADYQFINYLFQTSAQKIFNKRLLGGINGSKYDNEQLEKFIRIILKKYTLEDIKKFNQHLSVIIPTLDFTLSQPRIFDNINLDPKLNISLVDIALATSAAPTYFPPFNYQWRINDISKEELQQRPLNQQIYLLTKQAIEYQQHQRELLQNIHYNQKNSVLLDGGVIENIPVITTYTALRSKLGIEAKNIDMFIIGTGDDYIPCNATISEMETWSYFDWLIKFLIPYVTESNQLTSIYWGLQLGFNSFCYYNPLKVKGKMDDPSIITELKYQSDNIQTDFKKELYQFLNK